MTSVSMFEAKTNLSKYVASVEAHEEPCVVILRNGKPVAKIVAYEPSVDGRLGVAEGALPPLSLDEFNSIKVEDEFFGREGPL